MRYYLGIVILFMLSLLLIAFGLGTQFESWQHDPEFRPFVMYCQIATILSVTIAFFSFLKRNYAPRP